MKKAAAIFIVLAFGDPVQLVTAIEAATGLRVVTEIVVLK